ncbi:LysR family transcriptional regulator [Dyella agri]|uniref:LysR family transcriptional regulator n=1 Tax=Dyella agri TaxID=1926869 RepID=A0ABW8KIC5_9GAMM
MSKLPDFEGLAMFGKVAEEGSFAAAATAMGVSVATVSRAVTRLEERLGGRLFNRTSRRLALTDYGRSLAERAAKIYVDAEETEDFARETSSRPRGLIKLAVPLSFGARWVAPLLPEFFRTYPDIAVDLYAGDAQVDLIGEGFDAALRIAVMEDSSLVARLIAPVRRFVVASPGYLSRYGRPQHPHDLGIHQCLSYVNRNRHDVWRFTHTKSGEECTVSPTGMLRATSVEALLPSVLAGLAITEIPEFIAAQYFRDKQLEPVLADWRLPEGGLYFVTPTARARPAKVSALADFFISKLAAAEWKADSIAAPKPPSRRKRHKGAS